MLKEMVFSRFLLLFIILFLLPGCQSSKPIAVKTKENYKPLSSVQFGKKAVIAPVVLIYKEEKQTTPASLPLQKEIRQVLHTEDKFDTIPSKQQQDEIKAKISISLAQLIKQEGFVIQDTDQKTETLLSDVSNHHASLISQYRPKDSFQDLLSNIFMLSKAEGVFLVEVVAKQGSRRGGFGALMDEGTSSTSIKIAYISTKDANQMWYNESYTRSFFKETDIDRFMKVLIEKTN